MGGVASPSAFCMRRVADFFPAWHRPRVGESGGSAGVWVDADPARTFGTSTHVFLLTASCGTQAVESERVERFFLVFLILRKDGSFFFCGIFSVVANKYEKHKF
ncbi:hypothetical protein TcCL_NonESM10173 [Trypanosoma cruzi]|nr:hypothetical protein TcCL_NonESM10173 [Trypanosoma cruzi]